MASHTKTAVQDSSSSILALGHNILKLTRDMTSYMQTNSIVPPTFNLEYLNPPDTPEYRRLHATLKPSLEDLQ